MKKYIFFAGLALFASGCVTTSNDPNRHTKENATAGALMGALAGAVIGFQGDHSGGALRGALIGGAAGGAIGAGTGIYMDKQEAEFNRQLSSERNSNQIEIQRLQNKNLKITMNSEVSFDYNSAEINPVFENTLSKVSDILQKYSNSQVLIVGYTDDMGSPSYNKLLSERRAKSVAWKLEDYGLSHSRVRVEGRGSSNPRANNNTESGRQLNRRVELLITPN